MAAPINRKLSFSIAAGATNDSTNVQIRKASDQDNPTTARLFVVPSANAKPQDTSVEYFPLWDANGTLTPEVTATISATISATDTAGVVLEDNAGLQIPHGFRIVLTCAATTGALSGTIYAEFA